MVISCWLKKSNDVDRYPKMAKTSLSHQVHEVKGSSDLASWLMPFLAPKSAKRSTRCSSWSTGGELLALAD
jgi:hypothetical protein